MPTPTYFKKGNDMIAEAYFKTQEKYLTHSWSEGNCIDVEKEVQRRLSKMDIKIYWHLLHEQYEIWSMIKHDPYVIFTIDPIKEDFSATIIEYRLRRLNAQHTDAQEEWQKQQDDYDKNLEGLDLSVREETASALRKYGKQTTTVQM